MGICSELVVQTDYLFVRETLFILTSEFIYFFWKICWFMNVGWGKFMGMILWKFMILVLKSHLFDDGWLDVFALLFAP